MAIRPVFKRNININKDIRERYDNILSGFMFKDNKDIKDMKHIFMLCLALGYKNKNRKPFNDQVGLLNVDSFTDDDLWTIAAIAVEENEDLQVITNGPEMKRIASEYSHGGLDELEQLIFDNGTGETLELALEKIARESLENN